MINKLIQEWAATYLNFLSIRCLEYSSLKKN